MRCPHCETENRDDRENCYHCSKDLSFLRLIVNRSRKHYNDALEHAERGRLVEAVAELHHALELNANFAEARNLLGNLYARQERLQEAREQWDQVLSSDARMIRAHESLRDVEAVRRTIPLEKRVRWVLAGGSAAILFGLAVTIVAITPSAGEKMARSAWMHFSSRDLAGVRTQLAAIPRPLKDNTAEKSLQFLEESVARAFEERRELAATQIAASDFDGAQKTIEELRGWKPSASERKLLDSYDSMMSDLALKELQSIASAEFSEETLKSVRAKAEEVSRLFPAQLSRANEFEKQYLAAGEKRFKESLSAIDEKLQSGATDGDVVEMIDEAKRVGALLNKADEVEARMASLERRTFEHVLVNAREAQRAENWDEALDYATQIENGTNAFEREVAMLRSVVFAGRQASIIKEARAAMADDRLETAFELAAKLDSQLSMNDDAKTFLDEIARKKGQFALRSYQGMMRDARRFDAGDISEEEARVVLDRLDRMRDALPTSVEPGAKDDLLFFEAVAHWKLGDKAKAEASIGALREYSPRSPNLVTWKRLTSA